MKIHSISTCRQLLSLILVLCTVSWARAQDRIVRRDSTVIEARVLLITPDEVQYKRFSNPDGPTYVLPLAAVHRIVYPNGDCDLFIAPASGTVEPLAASRSAGEAVPMQNESAANVDTGAMTQYGAAGKVQPAAASLRTVRAYAVGDYYDEEGVRGVVCAVSDDGLHGLILSLEEATLAWNACPKSELQSVGASDTKDGRANMEAVARCIASGRASWEDFPAFAWCRARGEGWYLPAIDELLALCANYNGGTRVKNDREARNRFNEALRDHGGRRMDRLVFYFSSTEADGRAAYCSHTSLTPPYVSSIPKSDRFLVRAVHRF